MRRLWKRIGLCALAAAMALCACGCGGGDEVPAELRGHWVDVNGNMVLDVRGSKLTVTGPWNNIYNVKMETEGDITLLANKKDGGLFGSMSPLEVCDDGLYAYEQVLDADGHMYHFVREEDLPKYTEIRDLSTDAPKSIESNKLTSFSLVFYNSGGSYGLDPEFFKGTYSWTLERTENGVCHMSFRVMGDSYIACDFDGDVKESYAVGLARLLEDAGIEALNGYYWKNDVRARGWSLWAEYASGETLSLMAAGEAAAECPFDLPRLIDYAMEQGLVLKW